MIYGVVSVIIPTGGRPTFKESIRSLHATTQDCPVEVVVMAGKDAKMLWGPSPYSTDWQMPFWIINALSQSVEGSAIRAWNDGLRHSQGEYIVMAADDLVFHDGWLTEALVALREHTGGIGCVGFNDLHNGERHQTHFLMHRSFITNHLGGVLCPPVYHHFFVDREIVARARKANLYGYAKDSLVQHDHWANGRRVFDKWDASIANWMLEDEALFVDRANRDFPNDYEPVIHG